MSSRKRSTIAMGHDAFLDIVANLVGILIILVVILGTQSQKAINEQVEEGPPTNRASEDQMASLARFAMAAASAQEDSIRFETTIEKYDAMIENRRRQRGMMMDLVAQAEAAWEDMKQDLDKNAVAAAARQTEKEALEIQLASAAGERERLKNLQATTTQLQHLPTPMARTVFGEEIHVRLKDNRLSVVPIDGLLDEIRSDVQRSIGGSREGLKNSAVGPVRGYIARYITDKDRATVSRGGRVSLATRVQLLGFTVEPLEEPYGQSMDVILAGRSQLDIELAGRDPGKTTVTVWVYPDSFISFRKLKEHLYRRGFATAARPLEMHRKITASANGSRSSAQ